MGRVIDEMLPALTAEGLVDAVDAFAERIAFTLEETARLFESARRLELKVKLHVNGRCLAGPVGAEKPKRLAGLQLQADPVNGLDVGV